MATKKDRLDESKGMKSYWNSPAGEKRKREMSRAMKAGTTSSKGGKTVTREKRRRKREFVHVLPAALSVAAAIAPMTAKDPNGYSVVTDVEAILGGDLSAVNNIPYHLLTGIKEDWKDMAGLAIAAYASKEIGKMVGLNRIGFKKFRVA